MSQSEYWAEFMARRLSRRRLLGAGIAAGAGLWVGSTVGCVGGGEPAKPGETGQGGETPEKGGTMRVTLAVPEPAGTDPWQVRHFSGPAYEKLTYYTPKRDKIIPGLAESWEIPDDKTYVFKIKKGVKFHNLPPVNGRECTAEDFKYGIDRSLTDAPNFAGRPYFVAIDKMEAVDKYTLKITTSTPFAPLMNNLAMYGGAAMPKEIVDSSNNATAVIGTGPFMFDRWDRGEKMVWKRNPDYHIAGLPYLDAVEYKWAADYTTLVAIFISDQADMSTVYAQDMKTIASKRPKAQIQGVSALSQYNLIPRAGFKPTDDVRVRKAMDITIDRWQICYRLAGGTGELFGGSVTGPINHSLETWAIPMSELQKGLGFQEKYNKAEAVSQAKKLMAEAGYPNGFDLEFTNTPEQYRDMIVQMLQEWWKDIGIRVTIKQMDMTAFYSTGIKGDFQMMLWITGGDPDPDGQLYSPLRSGSVNNWGKWNDATLDKMLDDQRAAVDLTKRKAIVVDIQKYILDQLPRLWLYDWSTYTAINEKVRGFEVGAGATFSGWENLKYAWFAK